MRRCVLLLYLSLLTCPGPSYFIFHSYSIHCSVLIDTYNVYIYAEVIKYVQSTIGNIVGDLEEQHTQDDDVEPPKKRRRYFIM